MFHQDFDRLETFAHALREGGIPGVVLREIDEIRPKAGDGHSLIVAQVHEGLLLAYKQGLLLRCPLTAEQIPEAVALLTTQGVTLKRVSGNIS